jgi:thioredoxin 1
MSIQEITEENFDSEVLKSTLPVLVFFYDDGLASKQVWSLFEELAKKHQGRLKFGKLNTDVWLYLDAWDRLIQKYDVCALPTFLVFRRGQNIEQLVAAPELLGRGNQGLIALVDRAIK